MRTNRSKLYEQELFGKYSRDLLTKLYAKDLLSPKQIAQELGITLYAVNTLLNEYKIKRDEFAFMSKKSLAGKTKSIETIKKELSKDVVYDYYVKQNHTEKNSAEHFNMSEYLFRKLLKQYNIKRGGKN